MPRGGYRSGAGRPTGSLNKTSSEHGQRLSQLAKDYTHDALLTLVDVAKNGRSDAARVSAANALLDRGYGKPPVEKEIATNDSLPVVIQVMGPGYQSDIAAPDTHGDQSIASKVALT